MYNKEYYEGIIIRKLAEVTEEAFKDGFGSGAKQERELLKLDQKNIRCENCKNFEQDNSQTGFQCNALNLKEVDPDFYCKKFELYTNTSDIEIPVFGKNNSKNEYEGEQHKELGILGN